MTTGPTNPAEAFHRAAIDAHQSALLEALARAPGDPDALPVRIAVCDLISWAVKLHVDIKGGVIMNAATARATTPVRDDIDHVAAGVWWARNHIAHGRGHLLELERDPKIDASWNSDDMRWNDPESRWNGELSHPTVRFRESADPSGGRPAS